MNRISVHADPELSNTPLNRSGMRVEIVLRGGERREYPLFGPQRGNFRDPLSDTEFETKFRSNASAVLNERCTDALLDVLWHFEDLTDVGDLMRSLREVD
jgi:2-methylcitrate dehydratase PrpD